MLYIMSVSSSLGLPSAGTYAAAAGASACVDCGAGKFPRPLGAVGGREFARLVIVICTCCAAIYLGCLFLSLCVHVGILVSLYHCLGGP